MSHSGEHSAPLWLCPNLLSLDAPVIAVVWQAFVAEQYSIPLRLSERLALFLTVWAIYLADRLLDARKPETRNEPARHRFYRRYTALMTVLLMFVAATDCSIAFGQSMPRDGWFVAGGVVAYLGIVHVLGMEIPKAIAASALFTAGTFVAAWSALPCPELARAAAAFFVLCLANIVAIDSWESSTSHWLGKSYLIGVPLASAVCALAGKNEWYGSIAISAAAITTLFAAGKRLSLDARRALVDGALLSPIVFLIFR